MEPTDGAETTVTDEESLRSALSGLSAGDSTIVLDNDITVTGTGAMTISAESSVVLDLRAYSINTAAMFINRGSLTITGQPDSDGSGATITSTASRTVLNSGTLIVESGVTLVDNNTILGSACVYNSGDATIRGNLVGETDYALHNKGTAVVYDSEITNTNIPGYGIFNNEGTLTVTDAIVQAYTGINNSAGTLTVDADVTGTGAYAINTSGSLYVYGGSYSSPSETPIYVTNIDPELGTSGTSQILGVEHYVTVHDSESGQYVYAIEDGYSAASIGGVGYPDFPSAVEDAEEGQTIVLQDDVSTHPLYIDKGVNINLAGHDLTIENFGYIPGIGLAFASGTSSIIGEGCIIDNRPVDDPSGEYSVVGVIGDGTKLTVKSAMTSYANSSGYNDIVQVTEGGELVLEGATLTQSTDDETRNGQLVGVTIFGNGVSTAASKLMVSEGTSIIVSGYAINGNGSIPPSHDYRYTDIVINGGHIESTDSTAIYNPQVGTLTITGGEVVGPTAIEIRSGTLSISGNPLITGTYHEMMLNTGSPGNGNTVYGTALAISQHSTRQEIQVSISGGTFSGAYAVYEVFLIDTSEHRSDISIDIIGGTFIGVTSATTSPGYSYGFGSVHTTNVENFINGGTYQLKSADGTVSADTSIPENYLGSDVTFEGGVVTPNTYEVVFDAPKDMAITVEGSEIPEPVELVGGDSVNLPAGSYTYTTDSEGYVIKSGTFEIEIDSEPKYIGIVVELSNLTLEGPTSPVGEVPAPYEISVSASHGFTDAAFTYQWYDSSGAIEGATSSTYEVRVSGTYYVTVTATHGGYTSQVVTSESITVNIARPTIETVSDEEGNVTSTVTVPEIEGGNVAVDSESIQAALDGIKQQTGSGTESEKVIEFAIQSSSSVEIPADAVSSIIQNGVTMEVSSNAGTVVLEPDAAQNIVQQKPDADSISIVVTEAEHEDLTPEQVEVVGSYPVFELSVFADDVRITSFGRDITVELEWTIPVDVDSSDLVVFYVDDDGNIEAMPTDVSSGKVVFRTPHFTNYFIGEKSMIVDDGSSDSDVPVNPGSDDEDLPPFIPTQPAEDDDTVTIVACAAAAAVAAIMAVFLIIDRKG